MDIISEILETDRLAEEKLEQAKQKRSEMLAECEEQAEEILRKAKAEADSYRSSVLGPSGDADAANALRAGERERLAALKEAYDKDHEAWENEIVAAIIG